jgi:hypothetical protein
MSERVLRVYLGDGLYGEFDGYMVTLTAPRLGSTHYVGLEPEVMQSFLDWIKALALTYPELFDRWKLERSVI